MKSEYYETEASEDCLIFRFESVSEFRSVQKIIAYSPSIYGPNTYNLGLGDLLSNGKICDLSVSNNLDMPKIMATVVRSMLEFFRRYPDSSIYITGSTPARTRLYNIIISKELLEAKRIFEIYGLKGKEREFFTPNCRYNAFLIKYINNTRR